ncbi:MAG: sulfurtransferase [Caldilineaceae bacterium]|nr:sulfurtransferase [Caldilineaceae bacterium]
MTSSQSSIATGRAEKEDGLDLPGLLVTTAWLHDNLAHPTLRLLDVRALEHFSEGHLPHAVHVDFGGLSTTVAGVPGILLPPAPFAEKMTAVGVQPATTVVVYDDNWGMAAARVLWALHRYGFTQTALLTGGWDQWQAEGRPIVATTEDNPSSVTPDAASSGFTPQATESVLAERVWLLANLDNPDVVIVDTRGQQEFADGHVPGAVHWDWMNAVPVGGWEALRPVPELLAELAGVGITPDKEIVTYCRSGVRAAHTYWALRQLGYPRVRNYDGSWLEWQSVAGLPIEKNDRKDDRKDNEKAGNRKESEETV